MSYAIIVDAGYLYAESGHALIGRHVRRGTLDVNFAKLFHILEQKSNNITYQPRLKTYWYDAALPHQVIDPNNPIEQVQRTQMRLGYIGLSGEQKCVDTQILADMFELAHYGAITDLVLVSGDDDLRPGVELIRRMGVRVHIIGIQLTNGNSNQAHALLESADSLDYLTKEDIQRFITYVPDSNQTAGPTTPAEKPAITQNTGSLNQAMREFIRTCPQKHLDIAYACMEQRQNIPPDIDRHLIGAGRVYYQRAELTQPERSILRAAFKRCLQQKMNNTPKK